MSIKTAPPTATRSPAEVVAGLRDLANLVESACKDVAQLAAPVEVSATLDAGYYPGDDTAKVAMVDQVAALVGATAVWDNNGGTSGTYRAVLASDGVEQPYRLIVTAYARRPDPNAALHAELAELRAKVAAFESVGDERLTPGTAR